MAIVKHIAGAPGFQVEIWGETANINFFLNTPLVAATKGSVITKQAAVSAHTRRQYPGDNSPINVSSTQREFLYDPGAKNGSALPGKSFVLVSDAGLPGEERRQFTYVGRFLDLHSFFVGDVKMQVQLYSPSGKRYTIDGTTP